MPQRDMSLPITVIDLFAGPGGLGEGFASLRSNAGEAVFRIGLSIEKEPMARQTLELRALFHQFPDGSAPDSYYDYIRGDITREALFCEPRVRDAAAAASRQAVCATLGEAPAHVIDSSITQGLPASDPWVLIGGPPCQAYSLVGRSRMRGADQLQFEKDARHLLYQEYLRVIQAFRPPVFLMENVKGILSSMHRGTRIFEKIFEDLTQPADDLAYEIRSFVLSATGNRANPADYVIRSEYYGIPQARHRVILL